MRYLNYLLLSFFILAAVQVGSASAAGLQAPKRIAVYFYADWCPNCKILSPALTEARKEADLDNKDILFVTLNLTDKATIHQSILLAQQLGIGEFVKAQGSATGYVAVLDAKTKKELTRIDRTSDAKAIEAAFAKFEKP